MPTRREVAKYLKVWFANKPYGVWNDPIGKVIKAGAKAAETWKNAPRGDRGKGRVAAFKASRAAEIARLKALESTTYVEPPKTEGEPPTNK